MATTSFTKKSLGLETVEPRLTPTPIKAGTLTPTTTKGGTLPRKPKLGAGRSKKRDIPEGLWTKCPKCETMVFDKELDETLKVCPIWGDIAQEAQARRRQIQKTRHSGRALDEMSEVRNNGFRQGTGRKPEGLPEVQSPFPHRLARTDSLAGRNLHVRGNGRADDERGHAWFHRRSHVCVQTRIASKKDGIEGRGRHRHLQNRRRPRRARRDGFQFPRRFDGLGRR